MPQLNEVRLQAGHEHQEQHADVRHVLHQRQQADVRSGRDEKRPAEDVQERRPEQYADENLSEDGWLVKSRRQRARQLRGSHNEHQQQDDLERMRHRRS